jgi:hypothetical protein
MASNFVSPVHDNLISLVPSFLYDLVEALTILGNERCHDTLLPLTFVMTLLNIVNTLFHVMSDV